MRRCVEVSPGLRRPAGARAGTVAQGELDAVGEAHAATAATRGLHTRTSMRYEGSVTVGGEIVFSGRWQAGEPNAQETAPSPSERP